MKLIATMFCFTIDKSESLAPLVKNCGFSRPSKENPRSSKQYDDYLVELERREDTGCDRVFIRLSGETEAWTINGGSNLFEDLHTAGLISEELLCEVTA